MSSCKHDMAEQDTAVADGLCPLCLQSRIAELEQPWISVEERLPEPKQEVEIAYHDTVAMCRVFGEWSKLDGWYSYGNPLETDGFKVIAWRCCAPLPTPPEEQEG